MNFFNYLPTVDKLKEVNPKRYKEMSVDEIAYDFCRLISDGYHGDETEKARANREQLLIIKDASFIKLGRPYYKIYPNIIPLILNTKIEIPCKYLTFPFPAFEIKFSRDQLFQEEGGLPLTAMMVSRIETTESRTVYLRNEIKKPRDFSLQIGYQFFGGPDKVIPVSYLYQMGMRNDETIEECFEFADQFSNTLNYDDGTNYVPSRQMREWVLRIAVATCFFGVNNHEFVLPDLIRRHVVKYQALKESGKLKEAQDFADKHNKKLKWSIGSEITLPQPDVEYLDSTTRQTTGRELRYSHIRSGHLRFSPTGPRHAPDYKLIFIPPTLVRPDLPADTRARGYRIQQ